MGFIHSLKMERDSLLWKKNDFRSAYMQLTESLERKNTEDEQLEVFRAVNSEIVQSRRSVGAHAHVIYLSMLMTLIGIYFSMVFRHLKQAKIAYILLVTGVIIYPAGLYTQSLGMHLLGEGLALIGSLEIILFVVIFLTSLVNTTSNLKE